jgi:cyclic pyranopterin phosphate synthase
LKDRFGRNIQYMRISVTDRCNLRCRYCMPEDIGKIPMNRLLTYEEIAEVAAAAAELGITDLRVTGGDPLVRRETETLIGMLKSIPGIRKVSMTTNGVLLENKLSSLLAAGLSGVNISLDTLKEETFRKITGFDALSDVKRGIRAAVRSGIPVRINSVLLKGVNEGEWRDLAALARDYPMDVRFIEMMPIGYGRLYHPVSNRDLLERLRLEYPDMEPDDVLHGSGPAKYWRVPGWKGSIGLISPINGKFCSECNRIRLTSTGKLKPCLCYGSSIDLMPVLRDGHSGGTLKEIIRLAILRKPKEHCFETRSEVTEKNSMNRIGG